MHPDLADSTFDIAMGVQIICPFLLGDRLCRIWSDFAAFPGKEKFAFVSVSTEGAGK